MINPNFVYLAAVLNFIGTFDYLLGTIKGKLKPNRVTWILWSLAPLIAFAAEVTQGAGITGLMTFTAGFFPLLIVVASFISKKSYWKISFFDVVCGGFSLLGLYMWYITKAGNIAIFFSIFADLMAAIPTMIKSYIAPETESYKAYFFSALAAAVTLLTVTSWNLAMVGFPLYILIICSFFVILIKFRLGEKIDLLFEK